MRIGKFYVGTITDSRERINKRKVSQEGKKNELSQHSKGEWVVAWRKAGEAVGTEPGERFREQEVRLT